MRPINGESTVEINNTQLSALLDYNDLNKKTVPLRLAVGQPPGGEGEGGAADIILITDLSSSMEWKLDIDNEDGVGRGCTDPGINDSTTKRISLAKCLDKDFVNSILSNPNNRVGLAAFYSENQQNGWAYVYEEGLTSNALSDSWVLGKLPLSNS